MKLQVIDDADSVAQAAAAAITGDARATIAARSRYALAVSGGHTPWIMLRALANEDVHWPAVYVYQVDERVAPDGHPDRNLTHLRESLMQHAPLSQKRVHAMPVESLDLDAAAHQYYVTLDEIAGSPPVLDLVHLGLGPDGHTASLVPGDRVLQVSDTGRGTDWNLPGPPHYIDISGTRSGTQRTLGCDRQREGGDAPPSARQRSVHSRWAGPPRAGSATGRLRGNRPPNH